MAKALPTDNQSSRQRSAGDPFQRVRHARYFEESAVYHVVFRTQQGLYLLNPDAAGQLRTIIAGVLGRAGRTYTNVRNHATSCISNHCHMEISGPINELAVYVGFVKREISRRWGPVIGWRGIFEAGYHATAIITPEGQRRCLKYVLSQGVKEKLVARPEQWPGFHCAESLLTGQAVSGSWLNGTAYGTARSRERRKKHPDPDSVRREDFVEPIEMSFDKLPAFEHLSDESYRRVVVDLVEELVGEAERERNGRAPLGVVAITALDRTTQSELPPPPWFEDRRRMIVWDNLSAPEVKAYLGRYWDFQTSFRQASDRWLTGDVTVKFPPGSFRPGLPRPIPHILNLAP